MPQKRQERGDDCDDSLYMKTPEDTTFTIGQSYEDDAVTTLQCRKCGGKEFHVGQGCFYTAIMCIKCRWETAIHAG